MSWVADKLTAKVAQGLAAALLVLSLGLGVQVWVQSKRIETLKAIATAASAQIVAAETERESWKEAAKTAQAANVAYDVIFEKQRMAAEAQQRQAEEAARTAAAQVAAARRDEAAAERTAAEYRRVFGNRPKDCEAALQALDRVCPSLRSY